MMEDLLFLAHRIPYPPNKGDKIRSYNMLRHLARSYRIHLGAFVDSPADWRYTDDVARLCVETCFKRLDPRTARLRSIKGLLGGQPLTLPYYHDAGMQRWVEKVLANAGISRVFVFSSAMAQYVRGPAPPGMRRIVDFVDVDSDKWSQYSMKKRWPLNWVYRREARRLLEYDRGVAAEYDASLFVSAAECELFTRLAPEAKQRVACVENGVDVDYFSPGNEYENPYSAADKVLVFVGAMDYWANVDAVSWFATHVFPQIRERIPAARFYIVGSQPLDAVKRLGKLPGVTVTGAIRDIRPYLAHASMGVATLRIARGIQNKVLEAMAMDKPVLATTAATDGLDIRSVAGLLVSDDAQELVEMAVGCLDEPRACVGLLRESVCTRYSWDRNLEGVGQFIEGDLPGDDLQGASRFSASAL
jgi:sugar transferase (PEP-CTERM/EpsH1 system associated)